MLSDIMLGQFFPGNSILHRIDSRIKVVLLFLLIAAIFIFDSRAAYALLTIFTVALMLSSGISFGLYLKSLKPLWWILAFTFLIHLCSTPGELITKIWVFELSYEGFWRGFFLTLRLILLILMSSLLTFTTSPLAMTDATESLLRPLKVIGVPAHELAMMMTIALRFVPTLIEETDIIMKAQQSRGADFTSGNILQRLKNLIPILVPLFIAAFRRADDLAMAMEARCYRGGVGRTQMKVMKIKGLDYVAVILVVVLLAALTGMKVAGI